LMGNGRIVIVDLLYKGQGTSICRKIL
jgi:hypothetical protein